MRSPHRIPWDLSQQARVVTMLTNVGSAKAIKRGGTCFVVGYAWETWLVGPDQNIG